MRPDRPLVRRAFALVPAVPLALLLGACAGGPAVQEGPDASPGMQAAVAGLDAVGGADSGDIVPLEPGNVLGADRVLVLGAYRAASGRSCRRLSLPNSSATEVVCLRANGNWTATRRLDVGQSVIP